MSQRKRRKAAIVKLPRGVHKVISRKREFFYYQAGRNTGHAGPRIRLPDNPQSPEFWVAVRYAQGVVGPVPTDTINALIDAFEIWLKSADLSAGTKVSYKRSLRLARQAWGDLQASALRPVHIRKMMEAHSATPGKANSFLAAIQALSKFARTEGLIEHSLAEGLRTYPIKGGHKPWSEAQIQCAHEHLTGMVRRGVMLAMYTGQRPSDIVRLGWTDVDGNGFPLRQKKTGVDPWCPILPELRAEMDTWEKRPGPFLLRPDGKPFSAKEFSRQFAKARADLPELGDVKLHGLRATAVIRLRQANVSTGRIVDAIGLSPQMVERYSRFADRKKGGEALLLSLKEHAPNKTVKR